MKSNAQLTKEYLDIIRSCQNDVSGRLSAATYMEHSTAISHGKHIACSFLPKLFNEESYTTLKNASITMHDILCKVMQHYLDNAEYRSIFHYHPHLEELLSIPRRYESMLPFARVDAFFDEDNNQLRFCEFNADGSTGMNENREIEMSIQNTASFTEFKNRYHIYGCELINSWVTTFISIYKSFENAVKNPNIAIVDYLDHGVVDEFKVYAQAFEKLGYSCSICDVRELKYNGGVLWSAEGKPLHALWRRCVTNNVLEYWEESQQLIQAVREGAAALIGSFVGHIVHDKQIYMALFHPQTQEILSNSENQFLAHSIPRTYFLHDPHLNTKRLYAHKNEWVIKPSFAYGGDDVYLGAQMSEVEWQTVLQRYMKQQDMLPFLAQEYIAPYASLTLPYEKIDDIKKNEGALCPKLYYNVSGLYLFDGKFTGVFSRMCPVITVTKPMGALTSTSMWVKEE